MSVKSLKFKVGSIKHLRCTKDMSFNQQFITKWKETFRKRIGVYEKLINISKLFFEVKLELSSQDISRITRNTFRFISSCKNCGSYYFTCFYCTNNEYYRHIDDKIKMKENLKSVRNKRVIKFLRI